MCKVQYNSSSSGLMDFMQNTLVRSILQRKFDFCKTLVICIMCIIYVFWNIALDIFLKILKDKGMHQCDLFSHEELNIGNVLPLFKRVFLFCNHDS